MTTITLSRNNVRLAAGNLHAVWPPAKATLLLSAALCVAIFLHELVVVFAAGLLRQVATLALLRDVARALPLDPIYTAAAIEMAGQISVGGIAVAGPLGEALHAVLPDLFASPNFARTIATAVIWPGSSAFAQAVSLLLANLAIMALGLSFVRSGLREGQGLGKAFRTQNAWPKLAVGLLFSAGAAWQILGQPPTPADLEALGLSFAFGVLFPTLTGRGMAITDAQSLIPGPVLGSLAALFGLLLTLTLIQTVRRVKRIATRRLKLLDARRRLDAFSKNQRLAAGVAALVLGFAVFAAVVDAEPGPVPAVVETSAPVVEANARTQEVALPDVVTMDSTVVPVELPKPVRILGQAYTFSYTVDGNKQLIRGMGYNPVYIPLAAVERERLLERDFALMRRSSINTVFGWTTSEFDGMLLDKAQEQHLGVALPYHLAPSTDYQDTATRTALKRDVLDWVEAHKAHPALRIWAVGNEVLHKVVFPSWLPMNRNSEQSVAKAKAFATFYVDLIDAIHDADPNHPVLLRDAEDAYVSWIRDALKASPRERLWFVYGINIYTGRLGDVVAGWPKVNMASSLLVSEFAPSGLSVKDRPEGYRKMWATLRRQRDWTLGGVPYVWTTAGPEEVDRAFGLVDANGKAVDGTLDTIASMFSAAPDAEPPPVPQGPQVY